MTVRFRLTLGALALGLALLAGGSGFSYWVQTQKRAADKVERNTHQLHAKYRAAHPEEFGDPAPAPAQAK